MFGEFVHIKGRTEIEGKYYCKDCNEFFDTPHVIEYDESRGEFWGIPCSEHMVEWHCPMCDSEAIVESSDIILDDLEEIEA